MQEPDRRSTHTRRQVAAISAAVLAYGIVGANDEAAAASAKTLKRKVKDIKGDLRRMGDDVAMLEHIVERIKGIPGAEDLALDLRLAVLSLESKRQTALSR
jgi:hypothetical protein